MSDIGEVKDTLAGKGLNSGYVVPPRSLISPWLIMIENHINHTKYPISNYPVFMKIVEKNNHTNKCF